MNFTLNQIFTDSYPPEAALYCNLHQYVMVELDREDGHRRFQIREIPAPTEEELAERERLEAERVAESQRLPDLEDATIDLAEYTSELEGRLIELEALVAQLREAKEEAN